MNLTVPHHQKDPALSSLRFALGQALSEAKDQRSEASLCLSSQTQSSRGGVRRGDGSNGQGLFFKLNLTLGLI